MSTDDTYPTKYAEYEDMFDPMQTDRQARRQRRTRRNPTPRKEPDEAVAELADTTGLEAGFHPTYQAARHEEQWLLSSLSGFYDQQLITDVVAQVKGGKEASVYRCLAHPLTGVEFLAAKVYRPRMYRTMRNDYVYREGREILASDGKEVKKNDSRTMRAIGKKTAFGVQVSQTSWLMHEYATMQMLYQAGADVPRPVEAAENAVLMSYHGDEHMAAPTLNGVRLPLREATALWGQVLYNIDLMLSLGKIHGDLSAYNILYWEGKITLIDFPQVTDCYNNPNAYDILRRDIWRVGEYFQSQGVRCVPDAVLEELWKRHVRVSPRDLLADLSVLEAERDEEEDSD
ncbi:MAG: hypothetical protein GX552_03760 [Chloroflexi bacterium]|nr:hypothetical protein [Chloroflexota bacterium]